MSGIIGKRDSRGAGIVGGQVPANADIDHDSLANFASNEHYTQANITELGTVTGGTLDAGAALSDVTMSLGSDVDGDLYYRASDKLARLAKGSGSQTLKMNSGATAPEWVTESTATNYVKAWVNFDGTTNVGGNCTIAEDFNVTTVSDEGTGLYIVNFDDAMEDANYAITGVCEVQYALGGSARTANLSIQLGGTYTTSAVEITLRFVISGGSGITDSPKVCVVVFR